MALDIAARHADLDEWGPGKTRSRYDYDARDHLFSEIKQMGAEYFGRFCWDRLRSGDIVYLTDAASKRYTLIVGVVDQSAKKVWFDVDREHVDEVVIGDDEVYTVRWRGSRGGRWCVVEHGGKVVARDLESREAAQRAQAIMIERAA